MYSSENCFQTRHVLDKCQPPYLIRGVDNLSRSTNNWKNEKPISRVSQNWTKLGCNSFPAVPSTHWEQILCFGLLCEPGSPGSVIRSGNKETVSKASMNWTLQIIVRHLAIWATTGNRSEFTQREGIGISSCLETKRELGITFLFVMSTLLPGSPEWITCPTGKRENVFSFGLEDILNTWHSFRLKFSPLFVFKYEES